MPPEFSSSPNPITLKRDDVKMAPVIDWSASAEKKQKRNQSHNENRLTSLLAEDSTPKMDLSKLTGLKLKLGNGSTQHKPH